MTSVGIMASGVGVQGPPPAVPILTENFEVTSEWAVGPSSVRTGRTGVGGAKVGSTDMSYSIPSGSRTDLLVFGLAFWTQSLAAGRVIAVLSTDADTVNQYTIIADPPLNAIEVRAGGTVGAAIATSPNGVVATATWIYVEVRLRMHDTIGYVELYLNGAMVASAYNIDTKQISTSAVIDTFRAGGGGTGNTNKFDDLYLATDGGAALGVQRYGTVTDVLSEPFNNLSAWVTAGATAPSIVAGRNGNAVDLFASTTSITYTIPSLAESYFVTVGFAIKPGSNLAISDFLFFRSDAAATDHIRIRCGSDGSLSVNRAGVASAFPATPVNTLISGTWSYIEVQVLLHDTAGSVTIRKDGIEIGTLVDSDTKNAGTKTTIDSIRLAGIGNGTGSHPLVDDLRIRTGTLADFLGDVVVP